MRIQPVSYHTYIRNNNLNNTPKPVHFGFSEDYGGMDFDSDLDIHRDPTEPGFKNGLIGIISALTFPISFPLFVAYEKYKEKHKDDLKIDIDPDNIIDD